MNAAGSATTTWDGSLGELGVTLAATTTGISENARAAIAAASGYTALADSIGRAAAQAHSSRSGAGWRRRLSRLPSRC